MPAFEGSQPYWEDRYRSGGTSGSGSRGRLAAFKAEVLNAFAAEHRIETVLELGCGDGSQLALAAYPRYVGVDVSPAALAICRTRFAADPTKQFVLRSDWRPRAEAELALSLDVIFHLVEDDVFGRYMNDLFDAAHRYVIVYSSDEDRPWPDDHVRHRHFSAWVQHQRPEWRLVRTIRNRHPFDAADPENTSFSDFFVYELAAG